eukprot:Partr_v1_DN26722_c0_g1_i6_m8393 putative WD repeat domain 26
MLDLIKFRWLMDVGTDRFHPVVSIEERRANLYEQLQCTLNSAVAVGRLILFGSAVASIPSSQVLPPHRLETLLNQAIDYQISNCTYHNAVKCDVSLYSDHVCGRDGFPCSTSHLFDEHTDEVWFVSFSHNGLFLASASKDHSVIIWSVKEGKSIHVLTSHEDAVSFLAWSPNDKHLLSCGNDSKVKLWDVDSGSCLRTFTRHVDAVTSCAWLPEGDRFVSSSLDKTIYFWNVDGTLLYRWMGARITDLAIDSTGSQMIAVCHERKIRIYDLNLKSEQYIQEEHSITSLALSADSRYALVNVAAEEIHLWDLETKTLVHKYTGQKQGRFVIRSCFGGVDQNFIVSGSEDCNVYIWGREQGKLIEALPGHTGTVNSVSWNPKNTNMFASASDDCTIRIWGHS